MNVVIGGVTNGGTRKQLYPNRQRTQIDMPHQVNQWRGMKFKISDEEMQWLKGYFVGKTKELQGASKIQQKLNMEGWIKIIATPLGGDSVLIFGDHEDSIKDFLTKAKESPAEYFTEIKEWSPKMVNRERNIWLSITGVSIHTWKGEVFKTLVQLVGVYAGVDDLTRLKRCFDVGRVLCITTLSEAINRKATIKINGDVFTIGIIEEPFSEDFV